MQRNPYKIIILGAIIMSVITISIMVLTADQDSKIAIKQPDGTILFEPFESVVELTIQTDDNKAVMEDAISRLSGIAIGEPVYVDEKAYLFFQGDYELTKSRLSGISYDGSIIIKHGILSPANIFGIIGIMFIIAPLILVPAGSTITWKSRLTIMLVGFISIIIAIVIILSWFASAIIV